MTTFKNIEPRYMQDVPSSDDERRKIWSEVSRVMDITFGVRRGESMGSDMLLPTVCVTDFRSPNECGAWNIRIEKARRDIERHTAEFRVRDMADAITLEEMQNDILEIRTWANSLRKAT